MFEQYLIEQNLHWQNQPFSIGIRRELLDQIRHLIELDHIVAITGIRRCGKSYLLKQIADFLLGQGVRPESGEAGRQGGGERSGRRPSWLRRRVKAAG